MLESWAEVGCGLAGLGARGSLAWDRGKEMSAHTQFRVETGIPVFFADLQSQPLVENTNGLLRQYFPKGTDLSHAGPPKKSKPLLTR